MSPDPIPRPPDNAQRTIQSSATGEFLYWDDLIEGLVQQILTAIQDADLSGNLAGVESAINLINDAEGNLPNQTRLHEYQENLAVPKSVETTVLSYTVPALSSLRVKGVSGWGDSSAEWYVRVNGSQVSGGRTTPSNIEFRRDYSAAPIAATAGDVVTINCKRYFEAATLEFRAELLGVLDQ